MFSAPGRGPWGGPWSCLLWSCASWSTGMLQSGHTFRTSNHLMRHLGRKKERGWRSFIPYLAVCFNAPFL